MDNDYDYVDPKDNLPNWVKHGDKVQIVNISKSSAWYSSSDLIGAKGTFDFYLWFGGAWFAGAFTLDEIPKGVGIKTITISRVCLRKLDNLTR